VGPIFTLEKAAKSPASIRPPNVTNFPPNARDDAQDAVSNFLAAMASSPNVTYYWYNVIGNNEGSLLRRMGIDALAYGAVMLVAGLIKYRKIPNENNYTLVADERKWEEFIAAKKLSDVVQFTRVKPRFEDPDGKGGGGRKRSGRIFEYQLHQDREY